MLLWLDEAEELVVDLLALQGGRDAQTARLVLCAASLAQRDHRGAVPRLALLNNSDIEAAIGGSACWAACPPRSGSQVDAERTR